MDDEEVALKAKLDQTEDIDERLELRKQIREIRNRKFDEELKKISSGQTSSSKLTNDINSRKSIKKIDTNTEAGGDPYGLLAYTSEQSLQDLLNETAYTETDKRRKIRARMREVRNAEFDNAVIDSTRNKTNTEHIEDGNLSTRSSIRQPSPEPIKKKLPEPVRQPSPEAVWEPSPEPIREPSPEPVATPSPEPVATPSPEPIATPSPEPVATPSPEPIREPSPEPIREPSPEPVRERSPEPVRERSPEPVRERSPEPVRETSPEIYSETPSRYNRQYYNEYEHDREPSPQMRREQRSDSGSEYEEELTQGSSYEDEDSNAENKDVIDGKKLQNKGYDARELDYDPDYRELPASIVEKVLQSTEPGIKSGSDFKERLKNRQDTHAPLSLERSVMKGGEQVDFRRSLKRKSEAPAVNLERKPVESEQIDFRPALARKVDPPPVKNEGAGGIQVDFRTALKKKVEKPVFDKAPAPAAQVDFRNNLYKKVQTRTIEDKNLGCEQRDFRVVLGKAPLSPKTGRRHKGLHTQESVDRTSEDLERESTYHASELSKLEEISSADVQHIVAVNNEEEERKVISQVIDSGRNSQKTSKVELVRKASKKAPPPPPVKKKVAIPKVEHVAKTVDVDNEPVLSQDSLHTIHNSEQGISSASKYITSKENDDHLDEELANQEPTELDERIEVKVKLEKGIHVAQHKEESDEEVDGNARNRQIARAERTRRRLAKESAEKSKESEDIDSEMTNENNIEVVRGKKDEEAKSSEEKPTRRRSRRSEDSNSEARSERSSRRSRRLAALGDSQNDEEKKVEHTSKEKEKEHDHNEQTGEVDTDNTLTAESTSEVLSSTMNGFGEKDDVEEKTETPKENIEEEKTETLVLPAINGNTPAENDDEDIISRRESRKLRKAKEEEKVKNVSADLLAEINKPKDHTPKKSIESQLKKTTPRSTPLTGKAAEREAERLKREAEREERAAARARERDEAARKRKEQKDAFEKKMAEQKKARALKQRSNIGTIGNSARASRNAFKEKLESNSPAPASPSSISINTNITKLLGWAHKRTREYEGVNVENFHDSWSDGMAFAALIHSFCPDLIPIHELNNTTRRRNFELAFSVAKEEGVMDLLDVEDMVSMRSPDPKSVMTYVHSIYQTFQEPS